MAVQYAFGKIVTQGLDLALDAADPTSYPGTGITWTSVVNRSITGSLISCSFSSDFKGGIVFASPTASVQLPGTVANYGTGSFTIEMAFRPTQIQGIHYLVSKNSGSFPNWGVYLSGSGGSGKLFAEYRISSTVSCSVSSSTTFVTGSNYFVDVNFLPTNPGALILTINQSDITSFFSNGTGSLSSTSSLFLGNTLLSSPQSYSGSVYSSKVYNNSITPLKNYDTANTRFALPFKQLNSIFDILVVAGGGGAATNYGGGAGAGGLLTSSTQLNSGTYQVIVGNGGAGGFVGTNGENSVFSNLVAIGGGASPLGTGGSGGGANGASTPGAFGSGTPGQGNNGSTTFSSTSPGGGGGAGSVAGAASNNTGGAGGSGSFVTNFVFTGLGSPTGWFAGGGGGAGSSVRGIGGIGGGGTAGAGTIPANGNGVANTGGGGGGTISAGVGANGGSGVVIVRYIGSPRAIGGSISQYGPYTYHTFTTAGTSSFTVF
jgi:hypothetical protein